MDKRDRDSIQALAKEGKRLTHIMELDFPKYEYWEIYDAVYDSGGKSALGAKRTISKRLMSLIEAGKKQDREFIIDEVGELVSHLYESLKINQKKLQAIRAALD